MRADRRGREKGVGVAFEKVEFPTGGTWTWQVDGKGSGRRGRRGESLLLLLLSEAPCG